MVSGESHTVSPGTPVRLALATGAHTHVVVKKTTSPQLKLAGSSSASDGFLMTSTNETIHFVLELGEELWADAPGGNVGVTVLVGNQPT